MVAGPLLALSSTAQLVTGFGRTDAPILVLPDYVRLIAGALIGAAQPVAIGGGLLMILDIKARTRSPRVERD